MTEAVPQWKYFEFIILTWSFHKQKWMRKQYIYIYFFFLQTESVSNFLESYENIIQKKDHSYIEKYNVTYGRDEKSR